MMLDVHLVYSRWLKGLKRRLPSIEEYLNFEAKLLRKHQPPKLPVRDVRSWRYKSNFVPIERGDVLMILDALKTVCMYICMYGVSKVIRRGFRGLLLSSTTFDYSVTKKKRNSFLIVIIRDWWTNSSILVNSLIIKCMCDDSVYDSRSNAKFQHDRLNYIHKFRIETLQFVSLYSLFFLRNLLLAEGWD